MNQVNLMGRLTADPKINQAGTMASFTLAVDRKYKKDKDSQSADFIGCKMLGEKSAGFAQKYLHKGLKLVVSGRIQTGSYTDKNGNKVYTTDVIVEDTEFAESKNASQQNDAPKAAPQADDFMSIPDGIAEELPFS